MKSEASHRLDQVSDFARKASALGYDATLTVDAWGETIDFFKSCCAYCGDELERPQIRPWRSLSRGGGAVVENALPSCAGCKAALGAALVTNRAIKRFQRARGTPHVHGYDPLHRRDGAPGTEMWCGLEEGRVAGSAIHITCDDCERGIT